ncbi:hypothetical protein BG015_010188 [Linnemannia schmuckeri]|uniref:glucan endo-1,3-beta-D-glucosidase n=1 Tax=Linnemannia schmuckeri TaxID=64567 RepID=A0A9P5S7I5_9FUNG|nr:hypothetical protein BG015_010188 [Linnemannia schmuckeri]
MDPRNNIHSRVPPQSYIETLRSDTPSHLYPFSPSDNQDQLQHVTRTIDNPAPTSVVTVDPHDPPYLPPPQQQQQQHHFYEQHRNPIIYNGTHDNDINSSSDNFSGVGVGHDGRVGGPSNTVFHSLAASSASLTIQDSVVAPIVPPFSPNSAITVPAPTAPAAVASTVTSTTRQSSSFMDSIFKKKHHRRRSSSVLGWDSDDDEIMNRTTVAPSEHPSLSSSSQDRTVSEKSVWLQKEHGKQKRVKTCLCVGVVACFIALGVILAFTFKEQWTHHDGNSSIATHPKNKGVGGLQPGFMPGVNSREQLHQTIESTFHVNTTIIPDPNLRKVFYGIDYTPRGSQEPDCRVNLGNVIEDLKILSQLTSRIRLYGMACRQAENVMKALQYLDLPDMQVILTLWVDNNKASWEKQTRLFWNLIEYNLAMDADTYASDMLHEQAARSADTITISEVASRIIGISVGNEVLFRNEDPTKKKDHVPLETLDAYIQEIRRGLRDRAASAASSPNPTYSTLGQQLAQIPIFSSDLGRNVHQIVDKVDWVLSNIHPFFAYTSAVGAADWAFANFRDETLKAAGGKPAMISEVGWPSGPSSAALGPAVPSMENLQTFVNTWVCQANKKNVPYYYFEAFDEPWKSSINPRESQWGLMTVDRKLKVSIPNC